MYEHTFIEHVGNFSVICLAVILATAVHYAMLKRLNAGGKIHRAVPPLAATLWGCHVSYRPRH